MMLDELFRAIRHACPTPKWNHGTELARNDAVSMESQNEDEIILRVRVPARAASPAVRLYPEDEDWDCDCPVEHGACEHVAASIIALRNAQQKGDELPSATAHCARVQYRFERC